MFTEARGRAPGPKKLLAPAVVESLNRLPIFKNALKVDTLMTLWTKAKTQATDFKCGTVLPESQKGRAEFLRDIHAGMQKASAQHAETQGAKDKERKKLDTTLATLAGGRRTRRESGPAATASTAHDEDDDGESAMRLLPDEDEDDELRPKKRRAGTTIFDMLEREDTFMKDALQALKETGAEASSTLNVTHQDRQSVMTLIAQAVGRVHDDILPQQSRDMTDEDRALMQELDAAEEYLILCCNDAAALAPLQHKLNNARTPPLRTLLNTIQFVGTNWGGRSKPPDLTKLRQKSDQ